MGAVADQGAGLLAQGRDHQLALGACGHGLQGCRVDDFEDEMIRPVVDAAVAAAVQAAAGAVEFGQPVDVEDVLDAHEGLDTGAHGVAVALGTEDDLLQADPAAEVALVDFFGHQQRHRRGGAEDGRPHVHQHLAVHLGVGRPQRNGHRAEALAAGLKARTGGPQTVADRDLDAVLAGQSGQFIAAREKLGPHVHVPLGVAQHLALAGGARGGVNGKGGLKTFWK